MIVNGFCKEVFRELPMEFAVEAQEAAGVSVWREPSGKFCIRTGSFRTNPKRLSAAIQTPDAQATESPGAKTLA